MSTIVVMPGGFHPFHAGHASLYQSALKAFPDADVYVAATNDTKIRPFPFAIKEKLAKLAGVKPGRFVQVKSPFKAEEITSQYDPNSDVLVFVRSEKDRNEQPKPGGTKKDGTPAYFQPYTGKDMQPFSKHAYMAYLPTIEFGPGITSASEIRAAWPTLNDKRKTAMVMSLYPATQKNPKLAANVVKLLDAGMGEQIVAENDLDRFKKYIRPTVKTTPKIERTTNPAGRTTDHVEWKVTTPTGEIHRYKSKKEAQAHFDSFGHQGVAEARRNPEQNMRSGSGKYDLINYAEDINDKDNWAVSMTMEPKLGINPQAAVSEDTPKGIYFYPLRYFIQMANRDESLPWGDDFPYIQLFQYDRSGEMTKKTKVDSARLKQALSQYCSDEVIQQVSEEGDYDGTPYWFIYDCLSRLGNSDETNVIRWNKVLRDLGFTSVYDPGHGWIAYNEPTQGVVLDPRIIKQHKMFSNRNPKLEHRRYDMQGLADSIGWSSYYQHELQQNRIKTWDIPNEEQVRLNVAKSMLKPFLGKSSEEAEEMGYDKALKAAIDKVIETLKQNKVQEGITADMRDFFAKEKPAKQLMSPRVYRSTTNYLDHQKELSTDKEQSELAYLKMLLHTAMVARQQGKSLSSVMRQQDIAKLVMAKADGTLSKLMVKEDSEKNLTAEPVMAFYRPVMRDIHTGKIDDYVEKARELLQKTDDPGIRKKLISIFKQGKNQPGIQGGIITAIAALLGGGIISVASNVHLTPYQTNLLMQAVLNTVVPTVGARMSGKNWKDTLKYTLASLGVGVGIAGAGLVEDEIEEGFGLPYPGTYEQENNRTMHKDVSRRITAMTETNITEYTDYLEEK